MKLSLAESSEVDWTRAWSRATQEVECRGATGSLSLGEVVSLAESSEVSEYTCVVTGYPGSGVPWGDCIRTG